VEAEQPRETPRREAAGQDTPVEPVLAPFPEVPESDPSSAQPPAVHIRGVRVRDKTETVPLPGSLLRCPYCHADVSPERNDWVVCRDCLARHHLACWHEGKRCATCGKKKYLSAALPRRSATRSRAKLQAARPADSRPRAAGHVLRFMGRTLLWATVFAGIAFGSCVVATILIFAPAIGIPLLALAALLVFWAVRAGRSRSITYEDWVKLRNKRLDAARRGGEPGAAA